MNNRPDLDPSLPRYTVRYLDDWTHRWHYSRWKMTLLYAAIQFRERAYEIVWPSEEFPAPSPHSVPNPKMWSTSHLMGRGIHG